MKLPKSAAAHYGITRGSLGGFGNAAAERNSPIDWAAPSEQYSVFQSFRTQKGESFPRRHVSRARWVLPDGAVWNSPAVSDREMLGGGVPPCIAGAQRSVCSKPPDGTRAPRSAFCECMFGDLQPFRRFCNEASKGYEPWSHEGMAEMVKLAQAEGYNDFNPWSVPEAEKWKPHLDYRGVKVRSDWTSTVRLTDPDEYRQGEATRMRLLGGQDAFVCPQEASNPTGPGIVTTPVGEAIGGTVIGTLVPVVGGGFTVVPPNAVPPICRGGKVFAVGKDGKQACVDPAELKKKEEKKDSNLLPILAAAAAAAYFLL
jgi:hypothetical protein